MRKRMTRAFVELPHRRFGAAAVVSLASAACLCCCGDEEQEPPVAPAAPPAPVAAGEPAEEKVDPAEAVKAAREALWHQLLENMAPLVTNSAMVPEFNEPAKVYLESLQAYYTALAALPPSAERVNIAWRIAELTRNLGAYAKAFEAFERAQDDFDALPEGERNTVDGKRLHSALLSGTGLCLLCINKAAESIPYYEKGLEVDKSVLREVGIGDDAVLPEGNPDANVSRAVADVLGSYRCLGESHAAAGDLEEARDIYKKGIEEMARLKNLDVNSPMGIAYVRLHGALGDLENRCGKEREALASWVQAANLCKAVFSNSRTLAIKAQARRFIDSLSPLIVEKSRKLQEAAAAQQSAEAAREAAEAEQAAAEARAAQEAEEARAAEQAAREQEAEKAAAAREAEQPKEQRRKKRDRRRH